MSNKSEEKFDKNKELTRLAPYLTIGWQLAITIILGAVIGYFIDKSNDSGSKYMIIFMVSFTLIAFANLIRTVLRLNKEEDKKELKNKNDRKL